MVLSEGMLPIESVADVALGVKLVEDPVSIVLHRCGKNNEFIMLAHLLQEHMSPRSYQEMTTPAVVIWVTSGGYAHLDVVY